MNYCVGAARVDITPSNAMGVTMMGWGNSHHKIKGVATRAISIFEPNEKRRLVMVCLEIAFITEALRAEVIARTGLRDEELIMTATHTHSAPGGFSSYVIYGLMNEGIIPHIFETYVSGSVKAIQDAMKTERPARLRFSSGKIAEDIPVAFNRSIRARNRNPDVTPVSRKNRHLAVDREMTLLRFDLEDGTPIASWNWFSVHATSIHKNHFKIHSDNKGIAATKMEQQLQRRGVDNFVAVFAQGATGDVSPNYRWYAGLIDKRGARREDERSCRINARFQKQQAMKLFDEAENNEPLPIKIDGIFEFHDMASVDVDPDLVNGQKGIRTGSAELGVPLFGGTSEGGGVPSFLMYAIKVSVRVCQLYNFIVDSLTLKRTRWPWAKDPVHWNKVRVIACGKSEVFETTKIDKLVYPDWVDPTVKVLRAFAKRGILKGRPFTPHILPLQLAQIGNLIIAAVPSEFTTVSGARVRKMIETTFEKQKIARAIFQGYSNAYAGYVVTPEEYVQQGYETGVTHFGRWTLPAYLTRFRMMSKKMIEKQPKSTLKPAPLSPEYLKAFISTEKVS